MTKQFRIFLSLLFFSVLCCVGNCQLTTITGTITDSDTTVWFNSQWKVQFVPNSSNPNVAVYNINGVSLTSPTYSSYLGQTGLTNGSGALALTLLDNTQISPAGSSWKFTIQPYASVQATTYPSIVIQGGSMDLTSFLSTNAVAPRFAALGRGSFGYKDSEISPIPAPGGFYYNITSNCSRIWNSPGSWGNFGCASAGGCGSGAAFEVAYYTGTTTCIGDPFLSDYGNTVSGGNGPGLVYGGNGFNFATDLGGNYYISAGSSTTISSPDNFLMTLQDTGGNDSAANFATILIGNAGNSANFSFTTAASSTGSNTGNATFSLSGGGGGTGDNDGNFNVTATGNGTNSGDINLNASGTGSSSSGILNFDAILSAIINVSSSGPVEVSNTTGGQSYDTTGGFSWNDVSAIGWSMNSSAGNGNFSAQNFSLTAGVDSTTTATTIHLAAATAAGLTGAGGSQICTLATGCGTAQTEDLIITSGICSTSGASYGTCTTSPYSWPTAFADTNYTITCTLTPPTSGEVVFLYTKSKTTTGFEIELQNGTSDGAMVSTVAEIDCHGSHL
jgi:hypothetical protein